MASLGFEFGLDLFCRQQGITKTALAQAAGVKETDLSSWLEKAAKLPPPISSHNPFEGLQGMVDKVDASKSKLDPVLMKRLGLLAAPTLAGAGLGAVAGDEGGTIRGALTGAGATAGGAYGAKALNKAVGSRLAPAGFAPPWLTSRASSVAGGLGGAAAGGTLAYILSRYLKPVPEKTV